MIQKGGFVLGVKPYIKEVLGRVQFWFGNLEESKMPLTHGDHPEEGKSNFLSDSDDRKISSINRDAFMVSSYWAIRFNFCYFFLF